jgi:eukaryotic-like serine/threonine-protein kinase
MEENGQPKILDFGLARVTDGDMQATRQTDMGQLLGTLAYRSPEQVTADPLALDAYSGRSRSVFRGDVDHDSGLKPISVPG